MARRFFIASCALFFVAGCSTELPFIKDPIIELEIRNRSSQMLENAEAQFSEHVCRWGWVGMSASKSYMFYPHRLTGQVELHWMTPDNHHVEKLDLANVYARGESGRLTFTIYDDRVEASFRKELDAGP